VHWDVDPLQPAFAAALDLPHQLRLKRPVPGAAEVRLATLLLWVLQRHGVDLTGPNPAAAFGLTPAERRHLAAFVQAPTAAAARPLGPFLEGYGDPREMVIVRFAGQGILAFWEGWSRNGNKPAAPLVLGKPSGVAVYGVPSRWRSVGAARARAVWDRQGGVVWGESGDAVPRITLQLGPLGPPVLVVRLGARGLVVEGE
jgi:hypothetical protein